MRPKAAVAANIGAGPDIILGWLDDPHLYPEKLIDLTDLAEYLGKKYGGWFPAARTYATTAKGRWIGLPLGAGGATLGVTAVALQAVRSRKNAPVPAYTA